MDVILFRTHLDSLLIQREVRRLVRELGVTHDIFAIGHCDSPATLAGIDMVPTRTYSTEDLAALPYPRKVAQLRAGDLGHQDLPVLKFFCDHAPYDRYWLCEYDVRFSGDWADLFSVLSASAADVLCTTVQTYAENPRWCLWETFTATGRAVARRHCIKGFMPFSRLSRAALEAIDAAYRRGWGGHYEVTWPTIAHLSGLRVEDIGGFGSFTPPARRGKFYTNSPLDPSLSPGTFVFRPPFLDDSPDRAIYCPAGRADAMLWHPIKEGDPMLWNQVEESAGGPRLDRVGRWLGGVSAACRRFVPLSARHWGDVA